MVFNSAKSKQENLIYKKPRKHLLNTNCLNCIVKQTTIQQECVKFKKINRGSRNLKKKIARQKLKRSK